jgi:hypothetical protein
VALLCRTPLPVLRSAWEALTPGVEAGEQTMSRETMLHDIAPDVPDLRTELQRLGSPARDLADDDGDNATPVHRCLDGTRPANDPPARHMAVLRRSSLRTDDDDRVNSAGRPGKGT